MTRSRLTFFLTLASCAGAPAPPKPAPSPPRPDGGAATTVDAGAQGARAPAPSLPSLDAIAARGASEIPLMREALRVDDASSPQSIPAPADHDVCTRVIVAASRPVRAWLEDETSTPRGDVTEDATFALVPPRGPACSKKGEELRLVVDSGDEPVVARAVVWQAP